MTTRAIHLTGQPWLHASMSNICVSIWAIFCVLYIAVRFEYFRHKYMCICCHLYDHRTLLAVAPLLLPATCQFVHKDHQFI